MQHTIDDVWNFLTDAFSGIGSFTSDVVGTILSVLASFIGTVLDWLYQIFFVELWSGCLTYGNKLFNFFFNQFATRPFSIQSVALVVGFAFIVFAVKFTVSVIRG